MFWCLLLSFLDIGWRDFFFQHNGAGLHLCCGAQSTNRIHLRNSSVMCLSGNQESSTIFRYNSEILSTLLYALVCRCRSLTQQPSELTVFHFLFSFWWMGSVILILVLSFQYFLSFWPPPPKFFLNKTCLTLTFNTRKTHFLRLVKILNRDRQSSHFVSQEAGELLLFLQC